MLWNISRITNNASIPIRLSTMVIGSSCLQIPCVLTPVPYARQPSIVVAYHAQNKKLVELIGEHIKL
jgi:hypothetical protein